MPGALITGGGGFLAGAVARAFRAAGWQCVGIGRSDPNAQAALYSTFYLAELDNSDRFAELIERYEPSIVIHLAGPSSVAASVSRPQADLRDHIGPIATALEGMRLANRGARFLLVSSAAVYGNPEVLPVAESAPARPVSPYGFHKLMQEMLVDEYHSVFGVPAIKARLFSTFGEGLRKLAVWEIAKRALREEYVVRGTGDEVRDYLHADGIAEALLAITQRASFAGEAINVASGQGTTIRELASQIYEALGISVPPRFTGSMDRGNPTAWIADISKLTSLGFAAAVDQDVLLRRTVDWIRSA